ncbi:MAG: caspase family protein, partial [Bacteroidota bacterium]
SGNTIYKWNLKGISKEYLTIPKGVKEIKDIKNGQLAIFTSKGNILIYNANRELVKTLKAYTSIIDVVYDAKRERYLQLLADGVIIIPSEIENTYLIYSNSDTSPSGNYLFFTDKNNYTGNKGLYDLIRIRKNEKLFSSSHYDLEFNNPISIINNLKSDDKEYLDVLKLVQQKRNKKYGFVRQNSKKLSPEIFDLNDSIVSVTEQDTLNYLLQINGRDTQIKKLEGYLNGVPILKMNYNQIQDFTTKFPTTKSVGITTEKTGIFDLTLQLRNPQDSTVLKNTPKRFRLKVPVSLVKGTNTIEFFVTDTNGLKSNVLTYKVSKKGDIDEKYDLYAFAISVDDYKNDDYKLRYAKKDGRDILKFLSKNHISENYTISDTIPSNDDELDYVINDYTYRKIYTDSLFDEEVKKENLHKVAQFFSRAKPNDRVVLFISGHGVLDKNQDFYYAAQDLDFNAPEQRGISFKEIENILQQSNSKHKLLLIDACHSGEVDKNSEEEEEEVTESLATNVVVTARGSIGKSQNNKNKVGLQNSFELMKELFADVSRGSGIQVISAATGNSYALESDRWQNGIFTYCLLKGLSYNKEFDNLYDNELKNSKSAAAHFKIITKLGSFDYPYADYNQDDKVSVAELKEFVSKEVERMTNGKQKPTSRQGNIEFDFVMW